MTPKMVATFGKGGTYCKLQLNPVFSNVPASHVETYEIADFFANNLKYSYSVLFPFN
jgi:hypothetical protein